MRGLVLAWAVGLGIMSWRTAQQYHKPPVPGRLLGASLVYVALALISEAGPNAARTAALTAWAFNVAVFFEVGPQALVSTAGFGPATPAQIRTHTEPPGQGPPPAQSFIPQRRTGG